MTNSDEKDISNYMRFFCTRMVQAVVQARMGKMHPSPCVQASDQMIWFNLVMDEIGEVAAYLKSTIGRNYPPDCSVFSLEFILLTADGDKLPLETWLVRLDKECADKFVNIRTTLYQQMSTLLKSIIVASRFTPAYRHYVRNQGPDTFIFCYKVFDGEPDLSILGEETKYRRLGYLPSPFGAISVELYFRTKMEIQPQPFVPEEEILEEKSSTKNIGIAIPNEGSRIVPDLQFRASPKFIVGSGGHSFSSVGAIPSAVATTTSGTKSDPTTTMRSRAESPPTSNSFPERNSTPHQKLRVRNNSFPFSSLLLYSRSSSDQLKILPNVPEDDALNTTNLTNNPRGSNISLDNDKTLVSNKEDVRRNSSACTEEFVAFTINETSKEEEENNNRQQTSKFSSSKTSSVTSTSPINEQQQQNIKSENNEEEEEEEDEGEGGCCSSDNSYVKVIAFASTNGSNSELGTELSEFFKEVRFAPDKLTSLCTSESAVELKDQLDTFRQQESGFNQFISDLCEEEEE
uniref:Autophagy-related protein 13 n=2 Tax=Meloidogyne incognita TaxID=6306 RepID=A0A914MG19_MELIC